MSYDQRKNDPAFSLQKVEVEQWRATHSFDQIIADIEEVRPSLAGEFSDSEPFRQWAGEAMGPFMRLKYGRMIDVLADHLESFVAMRDDDGPLAPFDEKGRAYRQAIAAAEANDPETLAKVKAARDEARARARAAVKAKAQGK